MRHSKETIRKFIEANYKVCNQCGYNNKKERFRTIGTCLCCGSILDKQAYFKTQYYKARQEMIYEEARRKRK